jgi:hypothetical protein|tara:strand:+ start:110 stop:508 length:399 start_codon:yes stop_codon:yes gene_type:complete
MTNLLKDKILKLLRGYIDEWLLGFNDNDFNMGVFTSEKLHLQNAIINSTRVNEMMREHNIPFRLKAGIIGKLNVKSSVWNLFSESFKLELSDIHFIFGPNRDMMSKPSSFHQDPASVDYDCEDQINNIIIMA